MSQLKNPEKAKKNFAPKNNSGDPFKSRIAETCHDLVFISETDSEIKPIVADVPRTRSLASYLETLGINDPRIEEVKLDEFFGRLTAEKDWHGPREKKRRQHFAKLQSALENELEDLRVIRVGRVRLDIYIVGVGAGGHLAGVKTKAIET